MSSSVTLSDPILGKRSRTLSERVTENGDPLVIKKKARAAEKVSTLKKNTKACLINFYFQKKTHFLYQKASVEEVDDEDNNPPQKAIPKKKSQILERADGSDDDNAPIDVDCDSSDELEATEINESEEEESAEETAEAELGKCASAQVCFKIKLTDLKQKDCPMIGTHPFMFFLNPPLPSST